MDICGRQPYQRQSLI